MTSDHYMIWDEATSSSSSSSSWNLYENPIYNSTPEEEGEEQLLESNLHHDKIHCLRLPVSAGKMAASFWDLTFIKPPLPSVINKNMGNLEIIRALKAEVEYERKARQKMKLSNKRLCVELSEEKKSRLVLERLCEDLALNISVCKLHMDEMRKDMEDERKRQRVAEVFREERVKMKLADAKFLLDSKLLELDHHHHQARILACLSSGAAIVEEESSNTSLVRNYEPENPHIKRGIKSFVEFPKVPRAKTRRRLLSAGGSKLDYSKAQLSILLKQKLSPAATIKP